MNEDLRMEGLGIISEGLGIISEGLGVISEGLRGYPGRPQGLSRKASGTIEDEHRFEPHRT